MEFLIAFISRILVWLLGFVTWATLQVMKLLLEGLLLVFNAIPVCPCFATASAAISNIPDSVQFFAHSFQIAAGIETLICCWLLRFLIRRIPFIG
jgi:hypothetical protein